MPFEFKDVPLLNNLKRKYTEQHAKSCLDRQVKPRRGGCGAAVFSVDFGLSQECDQLGREFAFTFMKMSLTFLSLLNESRFP